MNYNVERRLDRNKASGRTGQNFFVFYHNLTPLGKNIIILPQSVPKSNTLILTAILLCAIIDKTEIEILDLAHSLREVRDKEVQSAECRMQS
jgi:hypothetical protein